MPTVVSPETTVIECIAASLAVKQTMLRDDSLVRGIAYAAAMITSSLRGGNRLFLMGNGGSAADAQHIAGEFVGRFRLERRGLPAMALTANTSTVTAISNDMGFEDVFARQVEAFARPGDVLLGISTSGNSSNVRRAMLLGGALQIKTIALTGQSGGKLKSVVDLCLCAPSEDTPRIQEAHILMGHTISEIVEAELFGRK
jgi:D-sedoheptulose 7-phosphate isomerase